MPYSEGGVLPLQVRTGHTLVHVMRNTGGHVPGFLAGQNRMILEDC